MHYNQNFTKLTTNHKNNNNYNFYLFPSLEAFRQLFLKHMIMNWMLVNVIVIIVFLHAALIGIQEVQCNHINVEEKEANQYPRRPLETDANYKTLIHDDVPLSTNSEHQFRTGCPRTNSRETKRSLDTPTFRYMQNPYRILKC